MIVKKQKFRYFKKNTYLRKGKGFTLIELLVVIAVIAFIAAVILSNLANARAKGRDAALILNAEQVGKMADIYFEDNGFYPTAGMNTVNCTSPPTGQNIPGAHCIYRPITPAYNNPSNTENINALIVTLAPYAARLPAILTGADDTVRMMNVFFFDQDYAGDRCYKDLEATMAFIPQANSYLISGRLFTAAHNPFGQTTGIFPYTGGNVPRGRLPFTYGSITCS